MASASVIDGWNWHPERDALLAEAHARPFTPLSAPVLVTRIATLSGLRGEAADRDHMAALCRKLGQPEPGPGSRWCVLDAGAWRLRWERHTEVSTWTFFRRPTDDALFTETAFDLAPREWLAKWPGEVLAAVRLEVRESGRKVSPRELFGVDAVGALIGDGGARVLTDYRPDGLGMTRFLLLDGAGEPTVTGRTAQNLLEIETYRLQALLAFPLAGRTATELARIETAAAELAVELADDSTPESDHALLDRLAALAGQAEALIGRTSFRFGASEAYHRLVGERIDRLREGRLEGLLTLGEFMQRRLEPAMRTCAAVGDRQRAAIDRIARMAQMLETRVQVAAETTNAALLASVDRRSEQQLRLQQTVEGLSVAAIAYYAMALLFFPLKGLEKSYPRFDATLAAGFLAPIMVVLVWLTLRAARRRFLRH